MERKCCRGNYEKHEEARCLARTSHSIGCSWPLACAGFRRRVCRPGADSTSIIAQSVAESNASDPFAWTTLASADSLRATADLPAKFDLRDEGAVSPVKLQNPWSACWAFAVAAASETSILSEAKDEGIDIITPDLSERHLTWFTYQPLPEDDDSNQGGEGMISTREGVNAPFASGGMMIYGAPPCSPPASAPSPKRTCPTKARRAR